MSSIVLQSSWRGKKADRFTLIVFLMYSDCLCSLALPHGDVDWSAVCECKIILAVWKYTSLKHIHGHLSNAIVYNFVYIHADEGFPWFKKWNCVFFNSYVYPDKFVGWDWPWLFLSSTYFTELSWETIGPLGLQPLLEWGLYQNF